MLWLKQKLRKWVQDADKGYHEKYAISSPSMEVESSGISGHNLRLRIKSAQGGVIIQCERYDERKGEYNNTYVLHDDMDLSENITHIITKELLLTS